MKALVVLPLHPRTRKTLGAAVAGISTSVRVIDPLPYLDMLILEKNARLILTDSGGIQKEAYWFGVPCVTLRDETEWIELVEAGCNCLVGTDPDAVLQAVAAFEASPGLDCHQNLYGDGRSANRIVSLIADSALRGGTASVGCT